MSINDLSPGNKLSLKGKIFELQKKLSLLDLEKKIVSECPFQPTFYSNNNYNVNNSQNKHDNEYINNDQHNDFNNNNNIEDIEYTYKPKINSTKIKSTDEIEYISQPVHIRLYEKSKEYKSHILKKAEEVYTKDSQGNLLFTPKINNNYYKENNKDNKDNNDNENNMKVQEYLYRDAMVKN